MSDLIFFFFPVKLKDLFRESARSNYFQRNANMLSAFCAMSMFAAKVQNLAGQTAGALA